MPIFTICRCGRRIPKGSRCAYCNQMRNAARRRGGITDPRWAALSRRILREWVREHGEWCPGDDFHAAHESRDLTVDHRMPLSLGGPLLDRGNLTVICRRANSRKGGRL